LRKADHIKVADESNSGSQFAYFFDEQI